MEALEISERTMKNSELEREYFYDRIMSTYKEA
jgi:hypothetical protein